MQDNLTVQCKVKEPTIISSIALSIIIYAILTLFFLKSNFNNMSELTSIIYFFMCLLLTTPIVYYIWSKYNKMRAYIQSIVINKNGIQIIETNQYQHKFILHNKIKRISYFYVGKIKDEVLSNDDYKNTLYIETKDSKVYEYQFVIDKGYYQQLEVVQQITAILQQYAEQYSFEYDDSIVTGLSDVSSVLKLNKTTRSKDVLYLVIKIILLLLLTPIVALMLYMPYYVTKNSQQSLDYFDFEFIIPYIFIILLYVTLIVLIIKRIKLLSSYKR